MLVVLGIIIAIVFLLICGTSPLDKPRTEDQRLNLSIGVFVVVVVVAAIVGLVVH